MKIEILNDQTVKVCLSRQDMQSLDLTYEQMDYHDPATRKAILQLLRKLRAETDLELDSCKLLIEAFPEESGGCILYINLIQSQEALQVQSERQSFDTPLIFSFASIDPVADASKRLLSGYSHLITHSSLYLLEKQYFLLLYTYCKREKRIISLLREYGTFWGKGALLSSFVQEHGHPLLEQEAIEVIASTIG